MSFVKSMRATQPPAQPELELQGEARARFLAGIQHAMAQVDAGEGVDDEEAQRKMDAWMDDFDAAAATRAP